MTSNDRPYSDADLRTEAAAQHRDLTADPDYMGCGERMTDTKWTSLTDADFDAAQQSISDLLTSAADTSKWAISMGADGLEPAGQVLRIGSGDQHLARIYFAFASDVPETVRNSVVAAIAQTIADQL
ncbi:hypothetical protein OG896_24885 [Streptomyces sp. NBC_00669]|uniref:hypothetical protein n=1 Tax=Streptomyces sp. NBC_00669 TaxID=2976011 RepID=UPI002E2EEE40|nr:hypothetical protein [Streptomyces sp. NBC_00669]